MVKGYGPASADENLLLARSYHETNEFILENDHYVVLGSAMLDEGVLSGVGDRLTPYLYSFVFDFFPNAQPIIISFIIYALAALAVMMIGNRMLGPPVGYIAGIIFSLFPAITHGSLIGGFYEFGVLFFFLGLIFFFKDKVKTGELIVIAVLFALAALSRNAFLISGLAILMSMVIFSKKKMGAIISVGVLMGVFFGAQMLLYQGVGNLHLTEGDNSFWSLGHLFPDPYVYIYEKEEFLAENAGNLDVNQLEFLELMGGEASMFENLKVYAASSVFYVKRLFTEGVYGGPLIVFMIIIGMALFLRDKKIKTIHKKQIVVWLILWYAGLVYMKTNNWDHFIEIALIAALFAGYFINFICQKIIKLKNLFIFLLSVVLLMHFVYANQNNLADEYNAGIIEEVIEIKDSVISSTSEDDIILVGTHQSEIYSLTWHTDRSSIYFAPETVEKLLEENIIREIFDDFGITAIAHYSDEILEKIQQEIPEIIIVR